MKNYFTTHNTYHTLKVSFWLLENVVIQNYNGCSKLTLIQKIEEPLSTCVSACLEASHIQYIKAEAFNQVLTR